jgi:hypothetical protein
MDLDMKVESKKYGIRLALKNSTETDLKLHSYVSSAPPLSKLLGMLSRSNEDALSKHDFELPQDSKHGIWIRYRYVDNETRGFDVRIHANFLRSREIEVNTDVYYIHNQEEEKIQSREITYAMYDNKGVTQHQFNGNTFDEDVGEESNFTYSAHVRYDIVKASGWDLCAYIEVSFSMTDIY